MNKTIANIRTFRAGRFAVRVDAVEEPDITLPRGEEDETARKIESGELTAFAVKAACYLDGNEIASDWLGNCIRESPAAFMDHFGVRRQSREASEKAGHKVCVGSYFADMVRAAIAEGRKTVKNLQSARVRQTA